MIRKKPKTINSLMSKKELPVQYPVTESTSSDIIVDLLYNQLYISEEQFKLVKQCSIENNISLVDALKKDMYIVTGKQIGRAHV